MLRAKVDTRDNYALEKIILKDDLNSLKIAAKYNNIDFNKQMSNKKNCGTTPLMLAIEVGANKIANYLLDQKVSLDAKKRDGTTALHHTVQFGNYEIASRLLKAKANVNVEDSKGYPPLDYLRNYKKNENNFCKLLLEHKADPLQEIKPPYNCLHLAIEEGDIDFLELLLKHAREKVLESKIEVTQDITFPYHEKSAVHKLIFSEHMTEEVSFNLMHYALWCQSTAAIEKLLKYGFDPLEPTSTGVTSLELMKTMTNQSLLATMNEHIKKNKISELVCVLKDKKNTSESKKMDSIIQFFDPSQSMSFTSEFLYANLDKNAKKVLSRLLSGKTTIILNALTLGVLFKNQKMVAKFLDQHSGFDVNQEIAPNITILQLIQNLSLKQIQERFEDKSKLIEVPVEVVPEVANITDIKKLELEIAESVESFNKFKVSISASLDELEKLESARFNKLTSRYEEEIKLLNNAFSTIPLLITDLQEAQLTTDAKVINSRRESTMEVNARIHCHLSILEKLSNEINLILYLAKKEKLQLPLEKEMKVTVNSKKKKKKKSPPKIMTTEEKAVPAQIPLLDIYNSDNDAKKIVTNKSIAEESPLFSATQEIAEYISKTFSKDTYQPTVGMFACVALDEKDQKPKNYLYISLSSRSDNGYLRPILAEMAKQPEWQNLQEKYKEIIQEVNLIDIGTDSKMANQQFQFNTQRNKVLKIVTVNKQEQISEIKGKAIVVINETPPQLFLKNNFTVELVLTEAEQKEIKDFLENKTDENFLRDFVNNHKDNPMIYRCCEPKLAAEREKKLLFSKEFVDLGEVYFIKAMRSLQFSSFNNNTMRSIPSCGECLDRNHLFRHQESVMFDLPSPKRVASLDGSNLSRFLVKHAKPVPIFKQNINKRYVEKILHEATLKFIEEKKKGIKENEWFAPAMWAKAAAIDSKSALSAKTKKDQKILNELAYLWFKQQADFQYMRGQKHKDALSFENAMLLFRRAMTYLNKIDNTDKTVAECNAKLSHCLFKLDHPSAFSEWEMAIALDPSLAKEEIYADMFLTYSAQHEPKSASLSGSLIK